MLIQFDFFNHTIKSTPFFNCVISKWFFFIFNFSPKKGEGCSFTLCNYIFVKNQQIIKLSFFLKFLTFFFIYEKISTYTLFTTRKLYWKSLIKMEIFIFFILNQTVSNCWSFVTYQLSSSNSSLHKHGMEIFRKLIINIPRLQ